MTAINDSILFSNELMDHHHEPEFLSNPPEDPIYDKVIRYDNYSNFGSDIEIVEVRPFEQVVHPTTASPQPQSDSVLIHTNSHYYGQNHGQTARQKLASQKGRGFTGERKCVIVPEMLLENNTDTTRAAETATTVAMVTTAAMAAAQPYLQMQQKMEMQMQSIQGKLNELGRVAGVCSTAFDLIPTQDVVDPDQSMDIIHELHQRQMAIQDRLLVLTEQMYSRDLFYHGQHDPGDHRAGHPSVTSSGALSKEAPLESQSDYVYTQANNNSVSKNTSAAASSSTGQPTVKQISLATPQQLRRSKKTRAPLKVQNESNKLLKDIIQHSIPSDEESTQPKFSMPSEMYSYLDELNKEIETLRQEFKGQMEDIKKMLHVPSDITVDDWSGGQPSADRYANSKMDQPTSVDIPASHRSPADQYPLDKQFAAYQPSTALDKLLMGNGSNAKDWFQSSSQDEVITNNSSNTHAHKLKIKEAENILLHVQRRRANLDANLTAIERSRNAQILPTIIGLMQHDEESAEKARIKAMVDDTISSLAPSIKSSVERQFAQDHSPLTNTVPAKKATAPNHNVKSTATSAVQRRSETAKRGVIKTFIRKPFVPAKEQQQLQPKPLGVNRRRLDFVRRPYIHLINDNKLGKPGIVALGPAHQSDSRSQPTLHMLPPVGRTTPTPPTTDSTRRVTFQESSSRRTTTLVPSERECSQTAKENVEPLPAMLRTIIPLGLRQYCMLEKASNKTPVKEVEVPESRPESVQSLASGNITENGDGVSLNGEAAEVVENMWKRELEGNILQNLISHWTTHQKQTAQAPADYNIGEIQRAIDEELRDFVRRLLERNDVESPVEDLPSMRTPTPSASFVPIHKPTTAGAAASVSHSYSDDFNSEPLHEFPKFTADQLATIASSPESLPMDDDDQSGIVTPEVSSPFQPIKNEFEDIAMQTEAYKESVSMVSECVGVSPVEEMLPQLDQPPSEKVSPASTPSIIIASSLAGSSLHIEMTDTNVDSFSEGVWLCDRSLGQEVDYQIDPVFKEKLGCLPMMLARDTQDFDSSVAKSLGEFAPQAAHLLEPPCLLSPSGEPREGSSFVAVCSKKKPIAVEVDPLLAAMSNRYRTECSEFQPAKSPDSCASDPSDGPSEASLQAIYKRVEQLKLKKREKSQPVDPTEDIQPPGHREPLRRRSFGETSVDSDKQQWKMGGSFEEDDDDDGDNNNEASSSHLPGAASFRVNVASFQPPKNIQSVSPAQINPPVVVAPVVMPMQTLGSGGGGGPGDMIMPSADFTDTGLMSTEQIINEAFMKTGGTSRDWAEETAESGEMRQEEHDDLDDSDISQIDLE